MACPPEGFEAGQTTDGFTSASGRQGASSPGAINLHSRVGCLGLSVAPCLGIASSVPDVSTTPARPHNAEIMMSRPRLESMVVMACSLDGGKASAFLGAFTLVRTGTGDIPQRRELITNSPM